MFAIISGVRAGLSAGALALAVALAMSAQPSSFAQDAPASGALTWAPASEEVPTGEGVRVAVRLQGPSGVVALEPEAVSQVRIDMGPDGMATMAAPLRPVAAEPGESLAWEADLRMAGHWALKVTAAVPGEAEPVAGEVVITAMDD